MTVRRKDNKNRVLLKGEIQRKDGIYEYRYTDAFGKRRSIYSKDLNDLRRKEKEIFKMLEKGINYSEGNITVLELVERYLELQQGIRYNTKVTHNTVLNILKKEDFANRKIKDINMFDAQKWFVELKEDGKGYSTIKNIKGVVRPAFEYAYNNMFIERNPFDFSLKGIISKPTEKREAISKRDQELFMNFIRDDKIYSKYYDELYLLLNTGMRVSEFCGLTLDDINFEKGYIRIERQLSRERGGKYYIELTKTENGARLLPIKDDIEETLMCIIRNRRIPRKEPVVDGYSGFLFIDKNGNPKVARHIENEMRNALKKYKKYHPDEPLPSITPHVLRHTYCTDMANANTPIKDLQYLMGHSDIKVTLGVYTHSDFDTVAKNLGLNHSKNSD